MTFFVSLDICDQMQGTKRLIELEALRGIAAVVVLIHHFMLGFTPRLHGLLYPDQPHSLFGTPAFALVNGSAAVVVFFVLSGFVLTFATCKSQDASGIPVAALKRWPRLAVTLMVANGIAGLLMANSLFANRHAASVIPSIWLGWFYSWESGAAYHEVFQGIIEGAITFFTGSANYNSNLWTMYYEFWGSMVAFGCVFLLVTFSNRLVRAALLPVSWVIASMVNAYLGSFVVGVAIAAIYAKRENRVWPIWTAFLILPSMILVFGYHENLTSGRAEGLYKFLNPLVVQNPLLLRVALHSIGATLALLLVLRVSLVKKAMSGELGRILGFMSFAVYLSQILVICSVSSWVYEAVALTPQTLKILICLLVTIAGTILLATPLAFFDRWWVRFLHRFHRPRRERSVVLPAK